MARPLRIDYPGAIHHVMNRGLNKRSIFHDSYDRSIFLTTLSETVSLWKIKIHAYSLMENHYHLLVDTPLGNLSRAMRHLDGVYTQRFNRSHRRDGPLMRGRFKSILVDKDSYFLELVRYIHLNGVRALLYPDPRLDPNSSHQFYVRQAASPVWLSTDTVFSFFQSDPLEAAAALDVFVKKGISEEVRKILDGKKWPALLGTKAFIKRIKETFIEPKPVELEKPQEKLLRRAAPPRRILRLITNLFGVELRDILCRSGARNNEARQAAIYCLRKKSQLTYNQIGQMMGQIKRSYISRVCGRKEEDLPTLWKEALNILEGKGET